MQDISSSLLDFFNLTHAANRINGSSVTALEIDTLLYFTSGLPENEEFKYEYFPIC